MNKPFLSLCVGMGKTAGIYVVAAVCIPGAFARITSQSYAQTAPAAYAQTAPAAYAQTAPARAEPTYSIHRIYKAGDVDMYRVHVHTVANGPQTGGTDYTIRVDTLMKETTRSVTPEGTVTIEDVYEQADSNMNGQQLAMTEMMPKVVQVRDKTGHTEVKTEGGNPQMTTSSVKMTQDVSEFQSVFLPTKPVKVGDTWTADGSKLAADDSAKSIFTVKLESVEMVKGARVFHIKAVADITGGKVPDTKMRDEITILVDARTGKPIKVFSKTVGVSSGTRITAVMTIDHTLPDNKKDVGKQDSGKPEPATKADAAPKKGQ